MDEWMTADAMCLEILLSTRPGAEQDRKLADLVAAAAVATGLACPYCGCREVEDGVHGARRCDDCGEQWDAEHAAWNGDGYDWSHDRHFGIE